MPASIVDQEEQERDAPGGRLTMVQKDEALVARAQKHDQQAIEELINRYQDRAYAIAYHMCSGDSEEAQDMTQEAFLKMFGSIGKFRGTSSFYTWFYRIVVNTCLDERRRRRRKERIFSFRRPDRGNDDPAKDVFEEEPDRRGDANPLDVLSGEELGREIRKAVQSLPEKQRTAFQLKVFHGLSIREIALVMNLAEGTIKNHLFRATHFMQKALGQWMTP
ncbi:MAG: sigma-70 family RNA polymerase sigma factor [Deltaproteobacteria bacterium]|nr:sigma-70 family RNA polymerase sigma factor [Deltaproteobacteria bacterium]